MKALNMNQFFGSSSFGLFFRDLSLENYDLNNVQKLFTVGEIWSSFDS